MVDIYHDLGTACIFDLGVVFAQKYFNELLRVVASPHSRTQGTNSLASPYTFLWNTKEASTKEAEHSVQKHPANTVSQHCSCAAHSTSQDAIVLIYPCQRTP